MTPEREILPSPVRVLMRNGQPCDEIITERPRFSYSYYSSDVLAPRQPKPRFVDFRERPQKVGRPRTRDPKPRPHAGKGQAWNRMDAVSIDRILDLQRAGLTVAQIARELGCTSATVFGRLRANRRSSPEASVTDDALRTCGCGRRKWASREICERCRREARKTPIPAPETALDSFDAPKGEPGTRKS